MSFNERCVHCEHYHNNFGVCCYCKKQYTPLNKTADEHRQDVEEILSEENSIDV